MISEKKSAPEFTKLPKGFKAHKGRCSWDAPQYVWSLHDYDEIEVLLRNGTRKVMQVCDIDWSNSFMKTDVVAWKKLDE